MRALVALAVLMVGWGWWYSSFGVWQPRGLEPGGSESISPSGMGSRELPLRASLGGEPPRESARAIPEVEGLEFEAGEWKVKEDARSDRSVLVEVLVAPAEGEGEFAGAPPISASSLVGIEVHAQSWVEATDATTAHVATTDEFGIARFEFPGACHLDWIRADIPAGYGHLAAFADPHEDVPAGSVVRFSLIVTEGTRVVGRVTDPSGAPLAGIPIWASDGETAKVDKELEDEWYPANYETVSSGDGTFEFLGLPSPDLRVGVAPGQWLQVAPGKPGTAESPEWENVDPVLRARFSGDPAVMVVDTIKIVEREHIELLVLDAMGQPIPEARLGVEPTMLVAPNLVGEEAWEREMDMAQSDWERERVRALVPWPRLATLVTAEDGTADFYGAAGAWRVHAATRIESTRKEFQISEAPGGTTVHELRFPVRMSTVSGQVMDGETRQPIRKAKVRLYIGRDVDSVVTDDQGRFEMAGLPVVGPFDISLSHDRYFTAEHESSLAQVPLTLTMFPAMQLDLRIKDHLGDPVGHQKVRLVRRNGDDDRTPLDAEGKQWLAQQTVPMHELNTTGNGRVVFRHLYPGTYDLELELLTDTGSHGIWGEALSAPKVWGRWSVQASNRPIELEVDLAGHERTGHQGYVVFDGIVRSKDGLKPIHGAEIRVTCGQESTNLFTAMDGTFRVKALAGRIQYEVHAPGHKPLKGTLGRNSRQRVGLRLDLERE